MRSHVLASHQLLEAKIAKRVLRITRVPRMHGAAAMQAGRVFTLSSRFDDLTVRTRFCSSVLLGFDLFCSEATHLRHFPLFARGWNHETWLCANTPSIHYRLKNRPMNWSIFRRHRVPCSAFAFISDAEAVP